MSDHEYRRISSTHYICRLCGDDMCIGDPRPCKPLDVEALRNALIDSSCKLFRQTLVSEAHAEARVKYRLRIEQLEAELREVQAQLAKIERMASCASAQAFLSLSDGDKARWFATTGQRDRWARERIKELEAALSYVAEDDQANGTESQMVARAVMAPDCENCGTPSFELEHLENEGVYYCPSCGCRTPTDLGGDLNQAVDNKRLREQLAKLKALIADDGLASSCQTLGQYRALLMKRD